MKNIIRLMTLALISVSFVSTAKAGIHIEPFLGYIVSGTSEQSGSTDSDISGTEFGLRLGYSITMFSFGLEYAKGNFTFENTTDTDVSATALGAFASIEFPILVRAYVSYHFKAEGETDTSPAVTYSGSGMRIGVGYTGLPFVAINLEQVTSTFDEAETSGVTVDLTNKIENSMTLLSLSVPLP